MVQAYLLCVYIKLIQQYFVLASAYLYYENTHPDCTKNMLIVIKPNFHFLITTLKKKKQQKNELIKYNFESSLKSKNGKSLLLRFTDVIKVKIIRKFQNLKNQSTKIEISVLGRRWKVKPPNN